MERPENSKPFAMAPFAMALSEHPDAFEAAGETLGQITEQLDGQPSFAVVFASASHRDQMHEAMAVVSNILKPDCLLGTLCGTVIAGNRELASTPAFALWATSQGEARGVRFTDEVDPEQLGPEQPVDSPTEAANSPEVANSPEAANPTEQPRDTLLLLGDPFSFPAENILSSLSATHPNLQVIGGLASGAHKPGQNQLWLDNLCYEEGAVGALIRNPAPGGIRNKISQGCQPVGTPFTVTNARDGIIFELGGRPALHRLRDLVATAPHELRKLMRVGVHVGIAIDESQLDYCDFLIRGIHSIDQDAGAVEIATHVEVGATVQFHVRNTQTAANDLRSRLEPESTAGALMFTCNGRGAHMFEVADREATLITRLLDDAPLAGMSCVGEIGSIGNQNFLLGFTASLALFGE